MTVDKLKNLTLLITDGKHGDCENADNSGYYFVSCKDVHDGIIDYSDARQITEQDFAETHRRTQLQPDDILVTNSGTIGRMALVKDAPETARTTFQKSVAIVKPDTKKIIPAYLYYCLLNRVTDFVNNSNGSAQKNLLLGTMRDFSIQYYEEVEKQETVVSIIKPYDDLIETNQRQIKLLEEAAQRVYKEWFIDLRFPGHENVPMVDGVPEGWKKQRLNLVSKVLRRGISPMYNDDGNYTVISQKCIRAAIMDIKESRRQEKDYLPELNLQDGDTVICSTGTGTLGRVGQVFGEYPNTTFDSHVTLVRTKQCPNYFYYAIKAQEEYLMGMGRGSTNQQELYRNVIEELEVFIPPENILNYAEITFAAFHEQITILKNEISSLSEARDRLLPKLMSGEIAV